MNKWKKKQGVYIVLIVIWMLVIFYFSHQQGSESEQTSKGVVINILNIFTRNLDIENKQVILYSILVGAVYASSDELHQFFVPGRGAKIADVLIDTIGIATGVFIHMLTNQMICNYKQKKFCK